MGTRNLRARPMPTEAARGMSLAPFCFGAGGGGGAAPEEEEEEEAAAGGQDDTNSSSTFCGCFLRGATRVLASGSGRRKAPGPEAERLFLVGGWWWW